ncbi:MAG TPA: DUF72 domain-containing protein [Pelobium sp.]|nr:DUF72 domain-containing protein [Pelobium sp.]
MELDLHIGCSGYYYPYWKNRFYPTGLQPKDWLAYYNTIFNTVELNGTFYRIPKLSDLKKYASNTTDDFLFSVKMNRHITHMLKLKGCKNEVKDFTDLIQDGLGNKLACILFQMPPSFHFNEENLQRVIETVPHHSSSIVEFRHISWWNNEVKEALTQAKITFCNVDFPGLESYFLNTSDVFYLRLHGSPELFKSSYSTEQLERLALELRQHKKRFVYFNNTYYEAGYRNAQELKELTVY